jgi:hypothetical protein
MNIDDFQAFRLRYCETHPGTDLATVVYKYVAGHARFCSHFGMRIDAVIADNTDLQIVRATGHGGVSESKCSQFQGTDGKNHFYRVFGAGRDENVRTLETILQSDELRIFRDEQVFFEAPRGIYTYIIGSSEDGQAHLFAVQVLSVGEVMTKHRHLFERLRALLVRFHYAGELSTRGNHVLVNFESGTLMSSFSQDNRSLERTWFDEDVLPMFQRLTRTYKRKLESDPDEVFTFTYHPYTLITSDIKTPRHVILLYLIAGLRVHLYESNCNHHRMLGESLDKQIDVIRTYNSSRESLQREFEELAVSEKQKYESLDHYIFWRNYGRHMKPEVKWRNPERTKRVLEGTPLDPLSPLLIQCTHAGASASAGAGGAAAADA